MRKIGSLDIPLPGIEDGGISVGDAMADQKDQYADVLDNMERQQLKAVLWPMVGALPGSEPEIIRKRYQEGMTFKEIGEELGLSMEAVRQWERKGLGELRKPGRSRILEEFLNDERIYNSALHGNGVSSFNCTWTSSTERVALRRCEDSVL